MGIRPIQARMTSSGTPMPRPTFPPPITRRRPCRRVWKVYNGRRELVDKYHWRVFAALLFGPAGNAVPPPSLSAQITLAAAAAIVIGVVDAALVALGLAGAQGAFQFVPIRIWLVAPMIWTVIAAITVAGL